VAYLPDCFQGNDDRRQIADRSPSRAELGLPDSAFVFCAFNNVYKFSPDMFDVWMRLLRAVPDSVLWIAADTACVRRNLAAEAVRRGIDAERLVFSPRISYSEHLARLCRADLFLDTLPFNAGTTASDALWAGLPVLTCVGESFAARMAGSLLRAVGLPELMTHCLDDYEALALRLATTPALLMDIRSRLAENRASAPLFDTDRFRRHLEAAYVIMLERHRSGATSSTFTVSPMGTVAGPFEAVEADRTFVAPVEPSAA
jgi:predicted O-linked N-acetylglucosamine transferase (SPINDLY family)